jgi:O-antigen ligase
MLEGMSRLQARTWLAGAFALVLLAAAITLLPTSTAVLVIGGVFLCLALVRWREITIYLLIVAVPFGSLVPVPVAGANVTAADGLLALGLALWMAQQITRRRIILRPAPLLLPFALFLLAAGLSLTVALSLQASAKELIKWVEMAAAYWLIVQDFGPVQVERALAAVLLAGLAEAGVGLYQSLSLAGPEGFLLFGGSSLRAFGTFDQPNPFAGYLGLIIPLAFGLVLGLIGGGVVLRPQQVEAGEAQAPHQRARSRIGAVVRQYGFLALALAALGAATLALFYSLSRGAWIAVAAALVVTTIIRTKRAAAFALAGAVLLALVVLLGQLNLIPDIVSERFNGVGDYFGFVDVRGVAVNDANFAIVERMAHWEAALGMFDDHPLLGVGIGNYAAVYPAYALPHWDDPLGHAHNYYLNVLAESGLVGLGAYLVMWSAIFWAGWRAVRSTRGLGQCIAAGAFGVMVALSVHNLFDNLFVHSMQIQVGLTLGLMQVVGREARGGGYV